MRFRLPRAHGSGKASRLSFHQTLLLAPDLDFPGTSRPAPHAADFFGKIPWNYFEQVHPVPSEHLQLNLGSRGLHLILERLESCRIVSNQHPFSTGVLGGVEMPAVETTCAELSYPGGEEPADLIRVFL